MYGRNDLGIKTSKTEQALQEGPSIVSNNTIRPNVDEHVMNNLRPLLGAKDHLNLEEKQCNTGPGPRRPWRYSRIYHVSLNDGHSRLRNSKYFHRNQSWKCPESGQETVNTPCTYRHFHQ
jgi:hypothetical protein